MAVSRANVRRRVRDQESQAKKREKLHEERFERLETMVSTQHEKLDRLEDLVYRVMHRDRVGHDGNNRQKSAGLPENIDHLLTPIDGTR
jgi:hypothetical protein